MNILYLNTSNRTFDSVELKTAYDVVSVFKRWESSSWQLTLVANPLGI